MNVYEDDASITNDAILWRRIPFWHLVWDAESQQIRISSAAFDDDDDGEPFLTIVSHIHYSLGRTDQDALNGLDRFSLSSVTAGLVREEKQLVAIDQKEPDPAHRVVFGKKTKSIRRKFAKAADEAWIIKPSIEWVNKPD